MYDKSKRELKDNKKYVVSKKSKSIGGKDSRKVKHVDSRMKKDKATSKKIKKTRHVKRKHKRRGKFWKYISDSIYQNNIKNNKIIMSHNLIGNSKILHKLSFIHFHQAIG